MELLTSAMSFTIAYRTNARFGSEKDMLFL